LPHPDPIITWTVARLIRRNLAADYIPGKVHQTTERSNVYPYLKPHKYTVLKIDFPKAKRKKGSAMTYGLSY
jgi:hypothetical protein